MNATTATDQRHWHSAANCTVRRYLDAGQLVTVYALPDGTEHEARTPFDGRLWAANDASRQQIDAALDRYFAGAD